jgi:HPt (histidine-containing phosphotransfer) domain-containing protein
MNIDKLRNLLGKDEAMVQKFLRLFKTEMPRQLNLLYEAVEQEDWKNVSTIAHGIKSQVKYLDLRELANTAESLERAADEQDDLESIPSYLGQLSEEIQEVIANL